MYRFQLYLFDRYVYFIYLSKIGGSRNLGQRIPVASGLTLDLYARGFRFKPKQRHYLSEGLQADKLPKQDTGQR